MPTLIAQNTPPNSRRRGKTDTPLSMVDKLAWKVNVDGIQDTALNDSNRLKWSYATEYRITNTLDDIRIQITPYIQWIMYIGLSLAVIAVIYNGFMMVTKVVWWDGDTDKVKKNLTNIAVGVVILTGFYAIIRLILGVIELIVST
jgi:hypothetical protein